MNHQPSVIGRYEILSLLPGGEGGMGMVYQARDPNLGRIVAIKILHDSLLTRPDILRRFYAEARAAANLSHPNIITIYDFGEDDGRPFIVMEFIRGHTLKSFIERPGASAEDTETERLPPLTLRRKLSLMEQLCSGLAFAHGAGVVHRDIKPANLLIDPRDTLTIVDFGIARIRDATDLTKTRGPLGTLGYMAPEQYDGVECDHRADIFAAGAVFYELMSGRQAFPGSTYTEVMKRVLNDEPVPLRQLCPDCDPRVWEIAENALAKDPRNRYQDMEEMRHDLEFVSRRALSPSLRATPVPQPRMTPVPPPRMTPAPRPRMTPAPSLRTTPTPRPHVTPAPPLRPTPAPPPGQEVEITEARRALESGDFDECARHLEAARAIWPDRPTLTVLARQAADDACGWAERCLEQGDSNAAEQWVLTALRFVPDHAAATTLLDRLRGGQPEPQPPEPIPPPPIPWYRRPVVVLASVLVVALASFAVWQVPGWRTARDVDRLFASAQALAASGDWSGAIREYDQVLRLAPGHAEAAAQRKRAEENQRRVDGEKRVNALIDAAGADVGLGNYEAARVKLGEALKADPANLRAKDLLAKVPATTAATTASATARQAPPPDKSQLLRLAQDHQDRGDYRAAIGALTQILRIDPSDSTASAMMQTAQKAMAYEIKGSLDAARAFWDAGKYDEAIRSLNSVLKIDPTNQEARNLLGLVQKAKQFDKGRGE